MAPPLRTAGAAIAVEPSYNDDPQMELLAGSAMQVSASIKQA